MVPLTTTTSVASEAKLAKLQKKLKKLQASRPDGSDQDEASEHAAAEAKLKKKVSKLQLQLQGASDGATAAEEQQEEEEVPKDKAGKKNKKVKRSADADGAAEQEGQQEEQQPKKKAKQANGAAAATAAPGKQQHRPHAGVDVGLAEVGNVELARSGKPIRKQLYTEHPDVAKLTAEQVQKLMEERETCVEGSGIKPLQAFEHTGLPAAMLHATRNFATPSPIQAQCWPIVLSGHDLIGIAATGSGKTLGFGLPALRHIAAQKEAGVVKGKGPFALVMAPTRELALQISEVLEEAGSKCGVRSVCVYGGVPKTEQVKALKQGVDIVIGTPGRLEDLMVNDGTCSLQQVTYFVLDEADRMLDLGFEPHIRTIASHIRSDRQTLMFSATWPQAVQKLASQFLTHPVKVTIGSQDLSASHTIKQLVEVIEPSVRDDRLIALLKQYHSSRTNRIIIFVLYKKEAPRVEQLLQRRGFKALAIHGDISQDKRTQAVERFKDGSIPLLIATDVAARGLDIPNVEVVINYSFPLTVEDYVHRIGRTGRAGKTGVAVTFFSASSDKLRAGELINVLREAEQPVPEALLKFGTAVKKKESKMYGAHFKDIDHTAKAKKMTFDSDDDE